MLETVTFGDVVFALIARQPNPEENEVNYLTSGDDPLQLVVQKRSAPVQPHHHQPAERLTTATEELLVIQKGKAVVDFYDEQETKIGERTLDAGDIIILKNGGHGIRFLEPTTFVEVKQGPHVDDKVKFDDPNR